MSGSEGSARAATHVMLRLHILLVLVTVADRGGEDPLPWRRRA